MFLKIRGVLGNCLMSSCVACNWERCHDCNIVLNPVYADIARNQSYTVYAAKINLDFTNELINWRTISRFTNIYKKTCASPLLLPLSMIWSISSQHSTIQLASHLRYSNIRTSKTYQEDLIKCKLPLSPLPLKLRLPDPVHRARFTVFESVLHSPR